MSKRTLVSFMMFDLKHYFISQEKMNEFLVLNKSYSEGNVRIIKGILGLVLREKIAFYFSTRIQAVLI